MVMRVVGRKGSADSGEPSGGNVASGVLSHAEGSVNTASGDYSHAEGTGTTASGLYGHAEGISTGATGSASHAEGNGTTASAANSHAEGSGTQASGNAAHAEGNGTTAEQGNCHAEGFQSHAQGAAAHAEGNSTIASGAASHAEGQGTQATGTNAHAEGNQSQATGQISHAQGFQALASRWGQHAQAAGDFAALGDAQTCVYAAHRQTTDATVAALFFDGATAVTLTGEGTNVLTLVANTAHKFRVSVVARRSDVSGDTAAWEFTGLVSRGSSGSAAIVGTVDGRAWSSGAGSAAWDVTLSVDTTNATNNYLKIAVTGEAAKTIRWVARIETVEVG